MAPNCQSPLPAGHLVQVAAASLVIAAAEPRRGGRASWGPIASAVRGAGACGDSTGPLQVKRPAQDPALRGRSAHGCCLCHEVKHHPGAGRPWARPRPFLAGSPRWGGDESSFPGVSPRPWPQSGNWNARILPAGGRGSAPRFPRREVCPKLQGR